MIQPLHRKRGRGFFIDDTHDIFHTSVFDSIQYHDIACRVRGGFHIAKITEDSPFKKTEEGFRKYLYIQRASGCNGYEK